MYHTESATVTVAATWRPPVKSYGWKEFYAELPLAIGIAIGLLAVLIAIVGLVDSFYVLRCWVCRAEMKSISNYHECTCGGQISTQWERRRPRRKIQAKKEAGAKDGTNRASEEMKEVSKPYECPKCKATAADGTFDCPQPKMKDIGESGDSDVDTYLFLLLRRQEREIERVLDDVVERGKEVVVSIY
jgi:hypothetical protein